MAGHTRIVEFLLSVGASPEEEDSSGEKVREKLEKAIDDIHERMSCLRKRDRLESLVEGKLFMQLSASDLLRQESSPSCSVESELVWATQRCSRLQEVLSLLTSPAEQLQSALENENLQEFIRLLESMTANTNCLAASHMITSLLVQVCEDGLYAFAKVLLEKGADPNNHSNATMGIPLLVAAREGHTPIVRLLVEHGAHVNVKRPTILNTALHEAAAINDITLVRYLLSVGADAGLFNSVGELPFDQTNLMELKKLLAIGNYQLLLAAALGDTKSIQQLVVEEGVSVNSEFLNGWTALHEACETENEEAASLLLELEADVNTTGGLYRVTPLHIASERDLFEVAKLLLKNGAKLDIKNRDDKVPFEVATSNQMRRVLVEARPVHPLTVVKGKEGTNSRASSDGLCLICMDHPINTLILPCGHQAFCTECVTQITQCALDRQAIREVISIYH